MTPQKNKSNAGPTNFSLSLDETGDSRMMFLSIVLRMGQKTNSIDKLKFVGQYRGKACA